MSTAEIIVKGAREHNLRSVDLELPRNQLICFTGVSGSGKSSLAFDTLYAEGQRRYVESLSSFARQFLGQMPKPDVDLISGLSPSISISQKSTSQNPRSTVGTITEIYDFLRVLYARVGDAHCTQCGRPITAQTREQILDRIMTLERGTRFSVLAPVARGQKGEFRDLFEDLLKQGFVRARVDGAIVSLNDNLRLDRQMRHTIEVVVDRLTVDDDVRSRLAEAVELALRIGEGNLIVATETAARDDDDDATDQPVQPRGKRKAAAGQPGDIPLSAQYACTHCNLSFEPPSPQLFSFNSPQGMCRQCDGLGDIYSFDPDLLVTDASKSFKQGAIELIGLWKDMGRWRRHIFQGVADTLEYKDQLPAGALLDTPWRDVDPKLRQQLLYGTGDLHITYTWRGGQNAQKYGGKFEGIIPELMSKYRATQSGMHRRQLEKYMRTIHCGECHGQRLNRQARAVTLTTQHADFASQARKSLPELSSLAVSQAAAFFESLVLDPVREKIAAELLKEIRGRLGFLVNVGLEYLTLERRAPTLSGGESQRIRLAGQVGCGLVGVLYILDEPSIGLHPRDNDRLLDTLTRLRDHGNTVIVVEHDEDTMRAADLIVDFGPGPGVRGGHVVAAGSSANVAAAPRSLTGQYLSGKRKIEVPSQRRPRGQATMKVVGAAENNLKQIDVDIPLGLFVCVTGVSGSGKSTLVNGIIVEALRRDLNAGLGNPGRHERIEGIEHLDKLIAIDQSPIGRTPRSNPATYIKVFDDIRRLYAQLPESKARGYQEGRFSFNVAGGRCEACEGNGANKLDMDFLADVWVTCAVCEGRRFNRETLQVRFKGKSISDVLEMDIQQALEHFQNIPQVAHKLQTLHDVGLDYLKLGQPSPTLSGGEAQRVKLARELVKKSTGRTLYLLDEPTTGLHFADIEMLLKVLHGFVEAGNTVLVVEHNLDVIKTADWVIDLGPEGGEAGGQLVAEGTPEHIANASASYTGRALAPHLASSNGQATHEPLAGRAERKHRAPTATHIKVQGARQHNLKNVSVEIPRDRITVCCGPSGSGKSSLAMDTIYAEGQRRYVESLSAYARQFVGQMQKPQIEHIEGLSPSIAIEQKHLGHTPRSTVGTVTEVYDYLRILYARLGKPFCPDCDIAIGTQTADEIIDKIMAMPEGSRLYLMAPLEIHVGEQYGALWEEIRSRGYVRMRVDGKTYSADEPPEIDRRRRHAVEVVIDRITMRPGLRTRVADSVESALDLGRGVVHVAIVDDQIDEERWQVDIHSQHFACDRCGRSFERLSPHNFSFNSALGWCTACQGLGTQTGANLSALIRDPKMTLAQGAVSVWPDVDQPLFRGMLEALSAHTGVPHNVPFEQLSARQRRIVLYGTEDDWISVHAAGGRRGEGPPVLRFQYKGLYPALEEASRLAPSFRGRLEHLVDEVECSTCGGSRLRDDAGAMRFRDRTIDAMCRTPLGQLLDDVKEWKLSASERKVAGELVREVRNRVQFLVDVGLDYLTLARGAPTLSGGEAQRIRLASQVGSGLTGVLYVLDEPTIGLHPRDNRRLIQALERLRDLGNTLLLVEHDREVISGADALLDFGPGAGEHGGQIVAQGAPQAVSRAAGSVTGPYLSGAKAIGVPARRRMTSSPVDASNRGGAKSARRRFDDGDARSYSTPPGGGWLEIVGARHNNLHAVDVQIPLGALVAVTGVSGSGKSSLVQDVLYASLARVLHRARTFPGAHDAVRGVEMVNKVIQVDQTPLGQTPTSNPATYTGVFDLIRTLYSHLPEAKLRGYTPRRFSFNVPGGRCEKCEGNGQLRIEMHFLPDVWVECDECRGQRYNAETLAVRFHGYSISDVLDMPCGKALAIFKNVPKIRKVLATLCDVGLDYVRLGQPAPTLSGGEAQRVKLAAELARPDTGKTLYLLDEPTTGLHFDDLAKLLEVLQRLVDMGNTVLVIEHNLDVVKTADWIIDIGPEAGEDGGQLVACGTPEDVVAHSARFDKLVRSSRRQVSGAARREAEDEGGGVSLASRRARTAATAAASRVAAHGGFVFRSYTGELLRPVLEAGPLVERQPFDPAAAAIEKTDDVDITEVGQEAQMPWQANGRRWHTQDRVGRNGQRCRWDGELLARVVDRVHELGEFSATNWNSRTVVEVSASRKADGWFLHAITGEEWLLKLKFRVSRNTFKEDELNQRLALKPFNEIQDLPVYGSGARVQCKNLRGPWQEVDFAAHSLAELDTPVFWSFLEEAVKSFQRLEQKAQDSPDQLMPWKVLGQKWHFSRRGFPPGKKVAWDAAVLEELCETLLRAAPGGQFLWNNQQVVHYLLPGVSEAWATIHTKRCAALELALSGPKARFALGRIADLGVEREVISDRGDRDVVKLRFLDHDGVARSDLEEFLKEHAEASKR